MEEKDKGIAGKKNKRESAADFVQPPVTVAAGRTVTLSPLTADFGSAAQCLFPVLPSVSPFLFSFGLFQGFLHSILIFYGPFVF